MSNVRTAPEIGSEPVIDVKRDRLVILASTLGTVFEWYDFFIYGTLATIIAAQFFPNSSPTAGFLLALATFGAGFGIRPLGAVVFGYLGDRLGRKYTFLATIVLMGGATAAIGLLPTYAQIGITATALLVLLRLLQGLALGGEYGGAAIYVAEHSPRTKRGFYTSFIQAGVAGGFLLSLTVVLSCQAFLGAEAWQSWGWRIPFLFSVVLLGISLWIRLMLKESPVFEAMKKAGTVARNPVRESFDSWPKVGRILVVLIGVAAALTVIWYTAQFQVLYFLQSNFRVEDNAAQLMIGGATVFSLFGFVFFGWLSDKVGRKKLIVTGYIITLIVLFPLFRWMADTANPDLARAMERAPVVVTGSDCSYDPFAKVQPTACGRVLDILSKEGLAYKKVEAPAGSPVVVTIGGVPADVEDRAALHAALAEAGYNLEKTSLPFDRAVKVMAAILVLGVLATMTYGPVAALLVELFPARVRYTSMSVPYHVGIGWFGGFLPFISQYIIARTGDPFAGLWYTFTLVAIGLVVVVLWLPETAGKELD